MTWKNIHPISFVNECSFHWSRTVAISPFVPDSISEVGFWVGSLPTLAPKMIFYVAFMTVLSLFLYRPLSVGGNAVELEDRTMGCSLHDNRLHCSVAIFFCPVLQFRGFDVTSERGLLAISGHWENYLSLSTAVSLIFTFYVDKYKTLKQCLLLFHCD